MLGASGNAKSFSTLKQLLPIDVNKISRCLAALLRHPQCHRWYSTLEVFQIAFNIFGVSVELVKRWPTGHNFLHIFCRFQSFRTCFEACFPQLILTFRIFVATVKYNEHIHNCHVITPKRDTDYTGGKTNTPHPLYALCQNAKVAVVFQFQFNSLWTNSPFKSRERQQPKLHHESVDLVSNHMHVHIFSRIGHLFS